MNKELFNSIQKQLTPSPEVRAALEEKLARTAKKRPVPWLKYGAIAACAVLVIGVLGASRHPSWDLILQHFRPDVLETPLHSYVTVEGTTGYVRENATTATGGMDTGSGGDINAIEILPAPNTGDLPNRDYAPSGAIPGGAYVGDAPVQEGAEDYQKLMAHFNGTFPDWYGGAYLDTSGWLTVLLVEDKDPGDKSLELQVLDWTGSDTVMFSSCKYSLAQLQELMDRLNTLSETDMKCGDVMAGWGIDEEANRIELTLTQVNDYILSVLAELDPDDDAILVQVGQRASIDLGAEDPAVYHVMPGGVTPEDDENLIATEPYYDGASYDRQRLPEDLPEQKQPAFQMDSAPGENVFTPAYDPDAGPIHHK